MYVFTVILNIGNVLSKLPSIKFRKAHTWKYSIFCITFVQHVHHFTDYRFNILNIVA